MNDTFENEDILIPEQEEPTQTVVEPIEIEVSDQEGEDITVTDILEKKVKFFSLPSEQRDYLKNQWKNSLTSEEDKLLADSGWSPEEMFGGKDRYGNPVKWKNKEEFKRDFIDNKKTSYKSELDRTREEMAAMKTQMEEMAKLVKIQTSNTLRNEEEELKIKIAQAKEDYDFETYDKLLARKQEIENQKQLFVKKEPEKQVYQEPAPVQLTFEEQEAVANFRRENIDFAENLMAKNQSAIEHFDKILVATRNARPDLSPAQLLNIAKRSTEETFSNIYSNKQHNKFMNTQTSQPNNANFIKKPSAPKIVFDNLSPRDKHFVNGALRNYPGMTPQQVAEQIFKPRPKK